jgi:NAD(P)-dependent dehydrogenase (short-subunit alcohol dehydrogenase family)
MIMENDVTSRNSVQTSREAPLAGRVAIITGGGRGLGRAMVLGLANAGATVIATAARERAELERLANEAVAPETRDRIVTVLADVTRDEDCARCVDLALERFGRLDVLVNNAGRGMKYVSENFMTQPTRFWETPPETWRLVIDTNVVGPFLMARAAVPTMLAAGWGRIINISINADTMRRPGFSPYGPSKAALESATVIWAQDLAGTGVTVNALLPGGAASTGMIPRSFPDHMRSTLLDPEIMVPPLLWLTSINSDGVTGRRFVASNWREDYPESTSAGW